MIKVKDLPNGYTIEYDTEGFMHNFTLKKDDIAIKSDKTQEALEQYRVSVIKNTEKEIADLANTFEKRITKDYISAKQGG